MTSLPSCEEARTAAVHSGEGELSRHVDSYIAYLKFERGLAETTIESYKRNISYFVSFLEPHDTQLENITRQDVTDYLATLSKRGMSPNTQGGVLSTLRGFFRFFIDEELLSNSPTYDVEAPRRVRSLPVVLSFEEVERLLAAPDVTLLEA